MKPEVLGARLLRDQPATCKRDAVHLHSRYIDSFLPLGEIDGSRKWRQDDELSKGEIGGVSQCGGRVESCGFVAGQAEDERAQNVDAVAAEILQPVDQRLSGEIEVLVNIFQSVGRDRFHADQRSQDVRGLHGIEEFVVLRGFHRDLGIEDGVFGEPCQAGHQFKAFRTNGLQLLKMSFVFLALRQFEVGQSDGIEIIVGQSDEAEAEASQLHDLFDDGIGRSLARLLSVGAPHRAKRTVLGASANRLHRGPHVALAGNQVPSRGGKLVSIDAAALVDRLWRVAETVLQHSCPDDVAVALHHGMSASEFERFFGIESGVNAAVNDIRPTSARSAADFVAAERIAGVNANADDIALMDRGGIQQGQCFVHQDGIAKRLRGGAGKYVQPAGSYDSSAERNVAGVDEMNIHACVALLEGAKAVSQSRADVAEDAL